MNMKNVSLIFVWVLFSVGLFGVLCAQPIVKNAISVNGLRVGSRYTQEQVVAALGQPSRIGLPQETDAYEDAYVFYYGRDKFYLIGGEFYGFDLWTDAFAVNGAIRVGDDVAEVEKLGGERGIRRDGTVNWRPSSEGLYVCTSVDFSVENGVVASIGAFIDDL